MLETKPSITAKICAFTRAYHSNYTREKVYDDYLAFDLLGKEEYEETRDLLKDMEGGTWNRFMQTYISPIILSRISFTENQLKRFHSKHEKIQYVICGAGMDSFAFRNADSNIEIYELDHPNTHQYKLNRIKELQWKIPGNVKLISIDFEKQNMADVLKKAGLNKDKKTFFAMLGVTYYLDLATIKGIFQNISNISAKESVIVLDYPDKKSQKQEESRMEKLQRFTGELGEHMKGGMSYGELEGVSKSTGFRITKFYTPQKIQQEYFEKNKSEIRAFENINFIMAEKI